MVSIQKGLSWFTESPGGAEKDLSLNHGKLFPDMHIRSREFEAPIAFRFQFSPDQYTLANSRDFREFGSRHLEDIAQG